jgi:putative colanic acid biosynthesis glycosyltransferase
MKLLQIDVNYTKSSTGELVKTIHEKLLSVNIDSYVCYGRGYSNEDFRVYKFGIDIETKFHALMTRLTGLVGYFSFFSTNKLIRKINNIKPDIVHLHELHSYFINHNQLLKHLIKLDVPVVFTFHSEYMYTGKCGNTLDCEKYKTQCKKCPQKKSYPKSLFFDFSRFMFNSKKNVLLRIKKLRIVSVSKWLDSKVNESFLKYNYRSVIHNGIDTSIFKYTKDDSIKAKINPSNEILIMCVMPDFSNPIKGGKFLELLIQKNIHKNIKFLIIGDRSEKIKEHTNVIFTDRIYDKKLLAKYYSVSDYTLLLSKKETFSLITAESLCCGTPVIGFESGGPSEVAPEGFGKFVSYGNLRLLQNIIEDIGNNTFKLKSKNECMKFGKSRYDSSIMIEKYVKLYRELILVR